MRGVVEGHRLVVPPVAASRPADGEKPAADVTDQQPVRPQGLVVLAGRLDVGPDRYQELDAERLQFLGHRLRIGPLAVLETPVAHPRPVEEVADDDGQRQPAPGVLAGDGEEFLLGAVAELRLPEPGGPLRQQRRMAGRVGVGGQDVGRRVTRRDPVVDLAGGVGDPARGVATQLHPACRRVVPQQPVAARGVQERDAGHRVPLHQVDHQAFLVQPAVLMLAQAVDPLTVVPLELLLQTVGAVAERGVHPRARVAGVRPLLGEQFTAGGGVEETDPAAGVRLDGDPAVDQTGGPVGQHGRLGSGRGRRRRLQGAGQPGLDRGDGCADPHRVRAPRLDAQHLVSGAQFQTRGMRDEGRQRFSSTVDGGRGRIGGGCCVGLHEWGGRRRAMTSAILPYPRRRVRPGRRR
jgi:hypothetical protein